MIAFLLMAACLASACAKPATPQSEAEYWPTQAWQISSPEEQGIDSARLVELFETIEKKDIRLHSLLILRNGFLVTEAYWHPYAPDDKHTIEFEHEKHRGRAGRDGY